MAEGGIEGRVENVIDGRAVGWAWDAASPTETLDVEVLIDDEPVAAGRADVERSVLVEAGMGHGRYGFDIQLPERLADQRSHTIRVTAGETRQEVAPFHRFETVVRGSSTRWEGTRFVPAGSARPTFVPDAEEPIDPGAAALIGDEGWLFPWDPARLSTRQLQGGPLITDEEVDARTEELTRAGGRLRALRIPYVFAVVPLKERVCGRFLPPGASLEPARPVARIDRALRATTALEVFDLLPALREARRTGRPFSRTDSGLSDLGAFFAYRELMRECAKRVIELPEPLSPEKAPLERRGGFRGDLAAKPKVRLVGDEVIPAESGSEGDWEEEIDAADVSLLRALRVPAPLHLEVTPGRAPHLYELADEDALPRGLLVGDDSCLKLIPWLAEHFRRFAFLWTDELPLEAIELEMPDVVIRVISEHRLLHAR